MGGGRAEGPPAIGYRWQAAVSHTSDADGMCFCIFLKIPNLKVRMLGTYCKSQEASRSLGFPESGCW